MNDFDVFIIGGGAAGLFMAKCLDGSGLKVAIAESNARVGKKLLATGNGKCNLTNLDLNYAHYNNPRYVEQYLSRFGAVETINAFEKFGLLTKVIDKRVYPYSECAATVLDVLRLRLKVDLYPDTTVTSLTPKGEGYKILAKCGEETKVYYSKAVALATGSPSTFGKDSLELYKKLGHSASKFRPSLCPIKVDKNAIKGLSGVRIKGGVRFNGRYEVGEILFKDFALSGIAIFNMSGEIARGARGDIISIDFMPERSLAEVETLLTKKSAPVNCAGELLEGIFHSKVKERLITYSGFSYETPAKECISALAKNIKDYKIKIEGNLDFSMSQVSSGGLDVNQFDCFESKLHKNLYAIGEVLDIDGDCGGYNLQWCWTSAYLAADKIKREFLRG